MLRFSPNLEFLFLDSPFLERFARARAAGFDTVEMHFVQGRDPVAIRRALDENALTLDGFNVFCGDFPSGDRGFAADPARVREFRASIDEAVGHARLLGNRKVHVLAGKRLPDEPRGAQWDCLVANYRLAADRLGEAGVTGLAELLNPYDNPGYFMESMDDVLALVDGVGSSALRIQFDFYHLQRVQGELLHTFARVADKVGHIQIADAPGRNEPGTGEINYPNVLAAVDASGYDGHVGLEYRPSSTSEAALQWIEEYGYGRGG